MIARTLLVGTDFEKSACGNMEVEFLGQSHLVVSKEENFEKLISQNLEKYFSESESDSVDLKKFEEDLPCNRKGKLLKY